ncbi:MAG TPA: urease accessory protein UreE [Gammaproteobacteria bacterium]|nr:urease accessory protein UreE [Gammaproteobacteria bacterium]
MLEITERLEAMPDTEVHTTLTLPFEVRQKSRFRAVLDDGREAGVILERGRVLRGGDLLRARDGTVVRIQAAAESVSTLISDSPLQLARACYHLGNRHVPLEITSGRVRYLHDHVLDDMVRGLGLRVRAEQAPFEPEPGAYDAGSDHHHGHHHHRHD